MHRVHGQIRLSRERCLRGAVLVACLTLVALFVAMPEQAYAQADQATIDLGRRVYRDTAVCKFCHGWHGKGERVEGQGYGADLTKTELERDDIIEVVRCGRIGTWMPRHGRQAWKGDDKCYGLTVAEVGDDVPNTPEKAYLRDEQVEAVADYIIAVYKGKEMTLENCTAFYGETSRICEEFRN